jgi:hypothetical protein
MAAASTAPMTSFIIVRQMPTGRIYRYTPASFGYALLPHSRCIINSPITACVQNYGQEDLAVLDGILCLPLS